MPLAISTGAGAASRHSIGTAVVFGMLAATLIAPLFIPLFFVLLGGRSASRTDAGVTTPQDDLSLPEEKTAQEEEKHEI